MSYPVLPSPAIQSHILPCPILSFSVLPCPAQSCYSVSYPALHSLVIQCPNLPYPFLSFSALPCPTQSCQSESYPTLPSPALLSLHCPVLFCLVLRSSVLRTPAPPPCPAVPFSALIRPLLPGPGHLASLYSVLPCPVLPSPALPNPTLPNPALPNLDLYSSTLACSAFPCLPCPTASQSCPAQFHCSHSCSAVSCASLSYHHPALSCL